MRLASVTSTSWPFRALQELGRGIQLDLDRDRFRRDVGEVLRLRRDAVVGGLVVEEFLLAEIGIVGRGDLGHGLANADLAAEFERVSGLFAQQLDCDRRLRAEALRRTRQVLARDLEIDDEAVLAVGILRDGIADVEHGCGDGLALACLFQDHVGIAVHQPVDRGEIARLDAAGRRGLRRQLHLGGCDLWRTCKQSRQNGRGAKHKRAHRRNPRAKWA
ncbi:hypothetical protein ACVWZ6_008703 [Bradyrhizobium sp. GM6.1]